MSQRDLFSYFTRKKSTSPQIEMSPVTKKQTAIRALKKVTKQVENSDSDFELSDNASSSSDEAEFTKLVKEEKLMKMNKSNNISDDSEQSDSYEEEIVEKVKPSKKTSTRKSSSKITKSSISYTTPIDADVAEIAKQASSNVSESDLPDWLTTNLKDANGNKPDSPNYDPSTVYISPNVEEKFTPFQKQFWNIKKNNFDAIVMIRKGKFYEMFSVDAIFARDVLKLHLTWRGKEPMCGVPEKSFSEWAIRIINAGKRVCKVEQMETAVDQRNRKGGEKAIVRELVQVYSLGTIDDFEMLQSSQPSYLLSLRSSGREEAGLCLVDCSTGSFHLGVVNQDDLADTLIRFEPVEVIYNSDTLCQEHLDIIKHYCGSAATRAKSGATNWDGHLALNQIQKIAQWDEIPSSLEKFPVESIAALGGCVEYLNEHKIAKSLLSLKKFLTLDEIGSDQFLCLDSSALINLNIIGKDEHCLLHILDYCQTAFGKRKLRFWLMHPLQKQNLIEQRLDAVEELMDPQFTTLSKKLKSIPDLERMLSRVYSNRCSVHVFIDCLKALKEAAHFISSVEGKVKSTKLKNLAEPGKADQVLKKLDDILNELEIEKSLETNEFVVKKGVFKDIDDIDVEVNNVQERLNLILLDVQRELKCKSIEFVNMQSERYQLQIPANVAEDLDDRFILMSKTKTVKRYHTPEIKELIRELEDIENERQKLRSGSQKRFVDDFSKYSEIWDSLVESISNFDCLLSLSQASLRWKSAGFCRPKFIDIDSEEANGHALLNLVQMRHPCLGGNPIPNDAIIHNEFILIITGPNASGKSTYARMCCLAIVLAQIGCYLPAKEATLTVYNQIFTRIGASDRLFNGQSTFAVECAETARLAKYAKRNSFVVLDELGRGTSTLEGMAIASAVLDYFIQHIKCPLIFCTHYHVLAEQYMNYKEVRNCSMHYEIKDQLYLSYTIQEGMCSSSFGCKVSELCGLPKELTEEAQRIANDFEDRHAALRTTGIGVEIKDIPPDENLVKLKEKITEISEQQLPNRQIYTLFADNIYPELKKLEL